MNVKPIRNHEDLSRAQTQLASLMSQNTEGEHDDHIEILAALIEQYERANVQILPPSPIAAIRFRMEQMGLAPRQLVPFIGTRARVSEVLSGKRSLSIDMIRSLHDGLRIPYASLLSERSGATSQLHVARPAVTKLNSLGFDVKEASVDKFVGPSVETSQALLRQTRTPRAASKTDPSALRLWHAAVLRRASEQMPRHKFRREDLNDEYLRKLALLSMRSAGPQLAIQTLAAVGIKTVILQSLPGTFLDGAALLGPNDLPVIALTLRNDKLDTFWFTLLHEAAHIQLHFDILKRDRSAFFDDLEIQSTDLLEQQADTLARDSLIPPAILNQVHWSARSNADDLIAVSSRARVHLSVVAGRWQRDHQNYRKFARMIERNALRELLSDT